MKFFVSFIKFAFSLYCSGVIALVSIFSFAETFKPFLENILGNVFNNPVTIGEIKTGWHGMTPEILISDVKVYDQELNTQAVQLKTLAGRINPITFLMFWPKYYDLVLIRPHIDIVSVDAQRLKVAGVKLSNARSSRSPKKWITWFLNNGDFIVDGGSVSWYRQNGDIQTYSKMELLFAQQQHISQQIRDIKISVHTDKGALALSSQVHGDLTRDYNWGAAVEVKNIEGAGFIQPGDLKIAVNQGRGKIELKHMQARKLRDFIRLTGFGSNSNWLLESKLNGQLENLLFEFSGTILDFKDWALTADVNDLGFLPVGNIPGIKGINGDISANSKEGRLSFFAQDATFSLPNFYQELLPIPIARGVFKWQLENDKRLKLHLLDGFFSDKKVEVSAIEVMSDIPIGKKKLENIADLFQVKSLEDLVYKDGSIVVDSTQINQSDDKIFVNARAEFAADSIVGLEKYFPNDKRIEKFRDWWQGAMLAGRASKGVIQYVGELTQIALSQGKASLVGQADFEQVRLDFSYQKPWPVVSEATGVVYISGDTLTIKPDFAKFGADVTGKTQLTIDSLFGRDQRLKIETSLSPSLATVADFLYNGPLTLETERPPFPLQINQGQVATTLKINLPIRKPQNVKVTGSASLVNGEIVLPSGVPISNLQGNIEFTERSVRSKRVKGRFLGHAFGGELVTIKQTQPPVLRLNANGVAEAEHLEPWIGSALNRWLKGKTEWQANVLFDKDRINIDVNSQLKGISIDTAKPLSKASNELKKLDVSFVFSAKEHTKLALSYAEELFAKFELDFNQDNPFAKSMISFGRELPVQEGINIDIQAQTLNLGDWLNQIIRLSTIPSKSNQDTAFLDAMRSLKLDVKEAHLFERPMGFLNVDSVSMDGKLWIGKIDGDNMKGTLRAEPRLSHHQSYSFDLDYFHLVNNKQLSLPVDDVDLSLQAKNYPELTLDIEALKISGKPLGKLYLHGKTQDKKWVLDAFSLTGDGFRAKGNGEWQNTPETGTMSQFFIEGEIKKASDTLDSLQMGGYLQKGEGSLALNLNWIGAPHEFDFSRLNGRFDVQLKEGELLKIEPGTKKLLGLFNSNVILNRLAFDFRDVFSKGLSFNKFRLEGLFADGSAIMREAYLFSPAVFIRSEGSLDLKKETIDMELFVSPELGGNVALLSALANPAAGAVVFLTQKLFKDEIRSLSFKRYRILGDWVNYELVEFEEGEEPTSNEINQKN